MWLGSVAPMITVSPGAGGAGGSCGHCCGEGLLAGEDSAVWSLGVPWVGKG